MAAQVHGYPSVLGLCVSFLLSLRLPLHGFYDDKIAHMWGAIAFISGRLFSLLAAMHAAFHGLLHASALIQLRKLKVHNAKEHNVQGNQKQTGLWPTMAEWLTSMLRAQGSLAK